jgi:nucleoside-diphosphate-sugar epimerase
MSTAAQPSPSDPRNVLVTGASGFIGGAVWRRFQSLGWRAVGTGRRTLADPNYHVHDLVHPLGETFEALREGPTNEPIDRRSPRPFDVVIHAAARSSPWGSRREFERQNVLATQNVVDYCRAHGRPKLVFLSSSSVFYRPGHQFNITEQTPIPAESVNRYSATKLRGEEIVRNYPGPWAILRPRAVFGPGDTVLLPRIIEAARAGRLPKLVSPDGPAVGDLIYVDNLVDYVVRAAADENVNGPFNLTNNEPVVIGDFLADVFRQLRIPPPARAVSVRKAMAAAAIVEAFYACFRPHREPPITRFGIHVLAYSKTFDVSRMLAVLGPPRISLAEAVRRTVESLTASTVAVETLTAAAPTVTTPTEG